MSNNQLDQDQYQPDFEELLSLAKDNPEQFEAKRLEYIEHFFTNVPTEKHRRLRGLQWQIDQARNLARTPMSSCLHIINMMWDSLGRLNDEHRTLVKLTTTGSDINEKSTTCAAITTDNSNNTKIIPFPTR